ncbi:helix-turn-helix domain-containing protein [Streptomyces sp. NBC_01485]|uniref:helix-turn-helix domain-containing protein n=1 Tax=Streptomyces sp. NBC_01485 TaxID=2903884 RepID=UPI002E3693E4|nr:helix-turn-helix domain-containing protein [Streptomyces sp. NBC_01485]
MEAAQRFERGVDAALIAKDLRVTERTVRRWRKVWREGGFAALKSKGPVSRERLEGGAEADAEEESDPQDESDSVLALGQVLPPGRNGHSIPRHPAAPRHPVRTPPRHTSSRSATRSWMPPTPPGRPGLLWSTPRG